MADSEKDKKDSATKAPPESIIIKHQKSPDYISTVASNVSLIGPSSDGLYHLIFYADSVSINTETTILSETIDADKKNIKKLTYKTSYKEGDIESFREDKAKIALPLKSIRNLRDLLNRQLPSETNKTTDSDDA